MNVSLENLNEIPKILNTILEIKKTVESGTVEKRWLNTRELAYYTGYKYETIKSKIKKGDFIQNFHYFKKGGILLFDKFEVDNWVMNIKPVNNINHKSEETDLVVNDILSSLIP